MPLCTSVQPNGITATTPVRLAWTVHNVYTSHHLRRRAIILVNTNTPPLTLCNCHHVLIEWARRHIQTLATTVPCLDLEEKV